MMFHSTALLDALNILLLQNLRPGILLIDVDEPSMDNPIDDPILRNQESVLKKAAETELPIFDIILHGERTIDRLRHIIKPSKNYIAYRKNMESAFDEENVELTINGQCMTICEYLRSIDCNHIFIMGYADDDCIFETAFDALNQGFQVYVDRMFNLGADLVCLTPWDSISQNPNLHIYTALAQPSAGHSKRSYKIYNMKILGH